MRRKVKYAVITIVLLMFVGCAAQDEGGRAGELQGAIKEAAAATPTETDLGDGPSRPIMLKWLDYSSGEAILSSELAFEVTNLTEVDIDVSVALGFDGLINMSATVDLGEHGLASGASVVLSVPAGKIPIQVADGAGTVRAEVKMNRITRLDVRERTIRFPAIYYRHTPDYSRVMTFDETVLIDQFSGKLGGATGGNPEVGQLVGRVLDSKGLAQDIRLMDDAFADKVDGRVIGHETGSDLSVGFDDVKTEGR